MAFPVADGASTSGGAGIYNAGSLTLTACTVLNNTDNSGNGGNGGGGVWSDHGSALTITGCLFTGNLAGYGAAIEHYSAHPAVVTNVTISGNTVSASEAGIIDAYAGGSIRLESCTVTGNTMQAGNSATINAFGGASGVQYRNSIVAGNSPIQFIAHGGALTSLGHNISSDGTGNLIATGDWPNTDPLLGPLEDNGGPTLTFRRACRRRWWRRS